MASPSFSIIHPELGRLMWSSNYLVIYVLKGIITLSVDNSKTELQAEDFLVINAGSLYYIDHEQGAELLCLDMPTALLLSAGAPCYAQRIACNSAQLMRQVSTRKSVEMVRQMLANLFELHIRGEVLPEMRFSGQAVLLFEALFSEFSKGIQSDNAQGLTANIFDYLRKALDFALQNHNKSIRLDDVARHIGISSEYLARCLRRHLDTSFGDIVKQMRVRNAVQLLRNTDKSVTEIAFEVGYCSASAFISGFKKQMDTTPLEFRKHSAMKNRDELGIRAGNRQYHAIRKYAAQGDSGQSAQLPVQEHTSLCVDFSAKGRALDNYWRRVASICSASDCLKAAVQQQILLAHKDLGFEYLYFHDIFNDDMMIYDENANGQPTFNFRNSDIVLRFLQSIGVKPYIELSFMPTKLARSPSQKYLNTYCISLPKDWGIWDRMIRSFLLHCIEQFGAENVRVWRFTPIMLYNATLHQRLSYQEFLEMYLHVWQVIKSIDPKIRVSGPGIDISLLALDWEASFQPFLDFCATHHCMPDLINCRLYPVDIRGMGPNQVTAFRDDRRVLKPSPQYFGDEGLTEKMVEITCRKLAAIGYHADRISIDRWNGNVSQSDPCNDICYKSAYIVKTILENQNRFHNMAYWTLSDYMVGIDSIRFEQNLSGSLGLLTFDGLKKAAYNAMQLLAMLQGDVIASGKGFVVTRDGPVCRIMVYRYCHYDAARIEELLSHQQVSDPYEIFVSGNTQIRTFHVKYAANREYIVEYFSVGPDSGGSVYEKWRDMGAPNNLTAWQREHLESVSRPGYFVDRISSIGGILEITCASEPHDVILMQVTPA